MKNILTCLLAAVALCSCSSDDDTMPTSTTTPADGRSVFIGEMNVTPQEGSPFNAFKATDIEFDIEAKNGSWTLFMPKIKFVEQMPVWIAFEVRDLQPVQTDGSINFSLDSTLPYWNGAPYDPQGDGKYEITELEGRCYPDGQLHVTFYCYSMQVDFSGQRVATSAEVTLP